MLHKPEPGRSYDFARYTYRGEQEVTMGYEYELTNPYGYGSDRNYEANRTKKHTIRDQTLALLPNYFKAEYEGFGKAAGVEIKSVVAPLFLHKQFWTKCVSKLEFDERPHSNNNDAGIHVSISRTPFTEAQQDKVFTFLHCLDHRPTFFKLSKRTRRTFDLNAPSHPDGSGQYWDQDPRCYRTLVPKSWPDHYNIINTENMSRYEFRLFAAHPTLLLPALEMCDSLFKMAPDVTAITIAGWRDYLACFKKYEHIKDHCIATLDHSPS